MPVPADVTAADAIATIEAALAAHGAYADVLVNSAGIGLSRAVPRAAAEDVLRSSSISTCAR